MTQDEILEMAHEAGHPYPNADKECLMAFAALVAARERKVCTQVLESLIADHVAGTRKSKNKLDWCAAEDRSCEYVDAWSVGAAAIRARSTT